LTPAVLFLKRARPPVFAAAPYAVPDAEALRQAALQRGWQRSQRVARRRVALRWLLWALPRYVLPAAAGLAVVFGLYLLLQSALKPSGVPAASPAALPAAAPASDGLQLRPSPQLAAAQTTPAPQPGSSGPVANPILKPDNHLHSKEP